MEMAMLHQNNGNQVRFEEPQMNGNSRQEFSPSKQSTLNKSNGAYNADTCGKTPKSVAFQPQQSVETVYYETTGPNGEKERHVLV